MDAAHAQVQLASRDGAAGAKAPAGQLCGADERGAADRAVEAIKSARSSNPVTKQLLHRPVKRLCAHEVSVESFAVPASAMSSSSSSTTPTTSTVSVTTVAAASNPAGGPVVPGSSAGQGDLASRVLQIMMQSARRLGEPFLYVDFCF